MCWKWCVRTRLHGSLGCQRTQGEQHNSYARRQTLWMKQCNHCSSLKVLKESRELQPSTISDNRGFPSTTGGSGLTMVNKKCGLANLASNKVFSQLQHQENAFWSWLNLGKHNNAKALASHLGHIGNLWQSLGCSDMFWIQNMVYFIKYYSLVQYFK